jgi:alpha-glucosidase
LKDPVGIANWPVFPGRDGGRTPMPWHSGKGHAGFTTAAAPWLPIPDAHVARAVNLQQRDPTSALSEWRAFLAWRRSCLPLLHGKIANIRQQGGVLAFDRVLGNDRSVCVFNISDTLTRYELPEDAAAVWFSSNGQGWPCGKDSALPAWGYLIAELPGDPIRAGERAARDPTASGVQLERVDTPFG